MNNQGRERDALRDIFGPIQRRYRIATMGAIAAASAWLGAAAALGLTTALVLVPSTVLFLALPLSTRRWRPAESVWYEFVDRQAKAWTRATGTPYTRTSARRWVERHPQASWETASALGMVGRFSEWATMLASLPIDSPGRQWQAVVWRSVQTISSGGEPDLESLERMCEGLGGTADEQLGRRLTLAHLRAWDAARIGRSGPEQLLAAGRSLEPFRQSSGGRGRMFWARFGWPVVLTVAQFPVWWILVRL